MMHLLDVYDENFVNARCICRSMSVQFTIKKGLYNIIVYMYDAYTVFMKIIGHFGWLGPNV